MRTQLRNRMRRAFTLIEILIVVVILGILAAIVIPQFTDASQEAMRSNLSSQLQTVRSQIELHDVQNPLTPFDPIVGGWDQLTTGDYLQSNPKNPFMNGSILIVAAPGLVEGWVWADPNTWGDSIYAAVPAGSVYDNGAGYFDGDGDNVAD